MMLAFVLPIAAQPIEAGSSVQITIMGVPAGEQAMVAGVYPVSQSGTINLPIINLRVRAAGMSPEALATSIQNIYKSRQIYTNPTIQVFATGESTGVKQQMVHIGGQVQSPGPKSYTKGLTIYQAIQAAGGATPFGSLKRVILYRRGKSQTLDVSEAKFMRIPLEPDDTIEVPQKNWLGQ